MYLTSDDVELVGLVLSKDKDIAVIIPDGEPYRWKAVKDFNPPYAERTALWHIPSGPIPLVSGEAGQPDLFVEDPWTGWTEREITHDPATPFFGAGRPGIFWLNVRPSSPNDNRALGLSTLEWIGRRYKGLGIEPTLASQRWWRSIYRRLLRIGKKVPRGTLNASLPPEVLAFPNAYRYLEAGCAGDSNPFDESLMTEAIR
jgi:hypothetical protein